MKKQTEDLWSDACSVKLSNFSSSFLFIFASFSSSFLSFIFFSRLSNIYFLIGRVTGNLVNAFGALSG